MIQMVKQSHIKLIIKFSGTLSAMQPEHLSYALKSNNTSQNITGGSIHLSKQRNTHRPAIDRKWLKKKHMQGYTLPVAITCHYLSKQIMKQDGKQPKNRGV